MKLSSFSLFIWPSPILVREAWGLNIEPVSCPDPHQA